MSNDQNQWPEIKVRKNGQKVLNFRYFNNMTMTKNMRSDEFTLAFVTRQNGGINRRFVIGSSNRLYGYWNGAKDQLHIDGWLSPAGTPPSNKEWDVYVISRNKEGKVWMSRNGVSIVKGVNWSIGFDGLFFNVGGCCGGETSDAELGEVALWKTAIGKDNVKDVVAYLSNKWLASNTQSAEKFSIRNNNNLSLWFDANDASGTGSTTGSTLSTWVDKSNGKNNLVAKAEAPIIVQNGIGGKPTILFENNKHFDGKVNINTNKLSIYSVIKTRNGGGFAERIIGFSDAPGNNDYNSGAYMGLLRQNGDAYGPYRGGVFNSNTIPRKVPTILSAWYDGEKQYSSVNGDMNYKQNNSGGNFNIKVFSVGKQPNMGDYGPARYDGEIAEILVFNDKLSKENHMQVEGYLAHKWNLQSYLPNDHPYKNSKPNVSV